MLRRVLFNSQRVISTRSLLKKRGGLPALTVSPGLSQGIGKAEVLQKRLYEAEYKETHAEDFHSPRSEEDGTNEILEEFRRHRAKNQEIAKRIDATPEYRKNLIPHKYDDELQLEINSLEATFYFKLEAGAPLTADAQLRLQEKREKICEYYKDKHAPVLSPICQRIAAEVEQEIESGQLLIGETDEEFVAGLYDRRSRQYLSYYCVYKKLSFTNDRESDPRILESIQETLLVDGDGEETPQELAISENWTEEELEEQKATAFVPTKKRTD